jgi:CDP-diacylglycerol--serine O-phosphatidyltransferase
MNLSFLPNLMTFANLFCGLFGIHIILNCGGYFGNNNFLTIDLKYASMLILIGSFFDLLDGFFARKLKITSKMGAILDSFADLITFGVLPSVIFQKMISISVYQSYSFLSHSYIFFFIPFIIPISCTYRLSRFNQKNTENFFEGLSSTASGIFISLFSLFFFETKNISLKFILSDAYILSFLSIVLAILMVSNIRFISFKFKNFSVKKNFFRYLIILNYLILTIIFGIFGTLIAHVIYIVLGILDYYLGVATYR